jgi:hypothetical protein
MSGRDAKDVIGYTLRALVSLELQPAARDEYCTVYTAGAVVNQHKFLTQGKTIQVVWR